MKPMIKQWYAKARRSVGILEETNAMAVSLLKNFDMENKRAERVFRRVQDRHKRIIAGLLDAGYVCRHAYVVTSVADTQAVVVVPEEVLSRLLEIAQDNTEEAYNRTIEETGKNPTYPKDARLIKAYADEMALISEIKQVFWGDGEIKTTPVTCTWTQDKWADYNPWSTACGGEFEITTGSPSENEMNFCPYCARRIVEVITDSLSDGDGDGDEQEQ